MTSLNFEQANKDAQKLHEKLQAERDANVLKWQKESFPVDPVLLYEVKMVDVSGAVTIFYALPNEDLLNPSVSPKLIFFDIIELDAVKEVSFINCSLIIKKVVFGTVDSIRDTSLMVYDYEMGALRPSKVLLGQPGITVAR